MKKTIAVSVGCATLTACVTTSPPTLADQYPAMYEEQPLSIVIMPPINNTNHAEAKDYFYTSLYHPLCEKGYYVFPPEMTMEMLQHESAYDAELFVDGDLGKFRDVLGADAALFTIIKDWRRDNVGGKITVNIDYRLRSTKTGRTLYGREGAITLDTSVDSDDDSNSTSLAGLIANTLLNAISTASTDKIHAGRKCNEHVLSNLPAGRYSESFRKDSVNVAGSKLVKATIKK